MCKLLITSCYTESMLTKRKFFMIALIFLVALIVLIVGEFIYILNNGTNVPAPEIPRNTLQLGKTGPKLTYVVIGDSTTIGQGAKYPESYAYQSAEHLAKDHQVSFINFGISGATAQDVVTKQLAKASAEKPDIVLLGVAANDVTHFTSGKSVNTSVRATIDGLRKANCDVKIVVTGSPAMGAVSRFPFGARQLAGYRTKQLNKVFAKIVTDKQVTMAPVAVRTGPIFASDPTLFAQDNFHPNARGYAVWTPVINEALDTALASTPVNCP
jgi:lysophospholipase L1-like esterase